MKKTSKNVKAAKGTLKISSFFTVQNKSVKDHISSQIKHNSINSNDNGVVNGDSDCDAIYITETSSTVSTHEVTKGKNDSTSVNSSPSSKITLPSRLTKKRKLNEFGSVSPPQKRSNGIIITPLSPNSQPSTSEYILGNITPTKNPNKPFISVKSPEALLSPEALRVYNTPEKKSERFMNSIRTPTPKKILFEVDKERSQTLNNSSSLLSEVDKLVKKTSHVKRTPKKVSPEKNINSVLKANTPDRQLKSPNKQKKTKLFEKSPNNLNQFNVQIIDNFVKITPSKSNKPDPDVEFIRSSEKKQSSILRYVSPVASARSLEAKRTNESTPTKESPSISRARTPHLKVKTKLDFSDCAQSSSTKTIASNKVSKSVTPVKEKTLNRSDISLKNTKDQNQCDVVERENDLNFTNIDFSFDENWQEDVLSDSSYNLDLSTSQHCKVINVNPSTTKNVVTLKSTKNGDKAVCKLEGFWMNTQISIGDTVHIAAKKINEREWIINNDDGLLVYEPDLLISTTSVVSTLWCKRKSVLSDRFGGFEPTNQQMLIGTLVHSLLQQVLKVRKRKHEDIEKIAKDLIKERNTIMRIYECGLTLQFIEDEVLKFVPKIVNFIELYVSDSDCKRKHLKHNKDDWKGTIKAIDDIEENIWCPELGIKGKVDVSVKTDFNTMPLELKTGRASVSLEHRGQVIMYIMMMNKLGYNVPSGLLLYLREGVLREIPMTRKEKRDIIILRNELGYYLRKKPTVEVTKSTKKLVPPELPDPINHSSCAKCPYNIICTSYAKYSNEDISSKQTLKNIQDEIFFYLEKSHLDYFMHWVALIALESTSSSKGSKNLREIYTLSPKERESNGKCIIDLKVTNVGNECNGMFAHTFEKIHNERATNFFANGIMESNYVVISLDNRPAISTGFVTDISAKSITVTLDRNLNKKYAGRTFFIDSYDSSSVQSYNTASLTLLLELTSRAEKLRQIIIDKIPPTFKSTLPKMVGTKGKEILRRLNVVQQRAVLKAIAAKDYFLIKGMPGTGKTATIVALIELLVELNKSVLITSHTHSAVDNVCLRLVSRGVNLLRLGSELRIHPSLKPYSEHNATKNCTTPEQLEAAYNAQVLAVTCLGSGHPVLSKRTVDICIVDESTQVLQCSVIRPLHAANTFILIGDQDQLPAVIQSKEAIEMGMSESLFERLYSKECSVALNLNYRMNSTITALANLLTYKGELLIGSESVANAVVNLPNKEVLQSLYKDRQWILRTLDDSLENSVIFLDSGPVWDLQHNVHWGVHLSNTQSEQQSCVNIYEAAITFHVVQALLKGGVPPADIGIITTYRAQVAQLSALLEADHIDISTVDQFQGKDKNVIIYSAAKSRDISVSMPNNKFELLEDKRRLTVAITRAKNKLIIIGDFTTLKQYSTFRTIAPFLEDNIIRLQETEHFRWEQLLDINI